jgi:hypothetical protein
MCSFAFFASPASGLPGNFAANASALANALS